MGSSEPMRLCDKPLVVNRASVGLPFGDVSSLQWVAGGRRSPCHFCLVHMAGLTGGGFCGPELSFVASGGRL